MAFSNPYASTAGQPNPYLDAQAGAITNQVTQNLQQNVLPGIGSQAQAVGGYGGSRHGIAQGMAINGANQALSNSLASLYGNAYEGDANRGVQYANLGLGYYNGANQYALGTRAADTSQYNAQTQRDLGQYSNDTSRMIGLGGLDNQRYGMDTNFYTQQRGQDLTQAQLGSDLYTQGINNQMNVGNWLYNMGQQEYNAPSNALSQYGNWLNQFSGLGGATNSTTTGGGGLTGALGGALGAAQLYNNLGFGSNTNTYNPYTNTGGWADTSLGGFFYGNGGSGG